MSSMHINTPLIRSLAMRGDSDRTIWLKMDALQPSGSFKLRGIGAACAQHAREGKRRFVSSSGGNAGIAVAYAGRELSIPVSVYVPQTTTETAKALIRQQGAEVIVHGASWQEANALAQSMVEGDVAFIHPFDDPLLWTGHATMIDEVVAVGAEFDAVVLSVGGGGLMCGVAEGLERNGLGNTPIIAVETRGADSLAAAMAAGHRIELPSIASIATSLGARRVCERAFALALGGRVQSVVVSDADAVDACMRFLNDHRVLVEPACGAALAAIYHQRVSFERVLVVVCGGATTSIAQLQAYASN